MADTGRSLIVLSCIFSLSLLLLFPAPARAEQTVRVKIIDASRQVSLSCQGYCRITDPGTGQAVIEGENIKTTVDSFREGISVGGKRLSLDSLSVVPTEGSSVKVNGRAYKGSLSIREKKRDRFQVVNHIGVEEYLLGIAAVETSPYWPMDALRAQAVVFRTYALYQRQQNTGRDYDLSADVSSQVYAGAAGERYRFSQAVNDTVGEVLTFGGRLLPAFFHSTCGGHTENAAELWAVDIPPLAGVVCPYCQGSPHYKWRAVLTAREIAARLFSGTRYAGRRIAGIEVISRTASGRAKELRIRTDRQPAVFSAKDFRSKLGADSIRSTFFDVSPRGENFIFQGRGWGHGAGLCQWGAYFLARSGADYKEILRQYYPGAEISTSE